MSPRVRSNPGSRWLVAGGYLSLAAAVLHVAVIAGGPEWYRFFGAGEEIAQAAERGEWGPPIMTSFIAAILGIWAAYAFSGAGKLPRLFLLRTGLIVITAIYLVRGLSLIPLHLMWPDLTDSFTVWSSVIVLIYGLTHLIGTVKSWQALSS